ncbi:phosphonate ABC transporter, permease protein PhnE [Nocardiopsis sp. CNT312]|uniref:phosphonate ABC transporter, permease protein PhnE n=1 Tax=Nocardiopsis sp. CNT312 TaxID=1137268 RepID=UPI0004AC574D|nr:phosphonate ABC transporter, permease protein PhnE [Nocardiopsis sp. CNT312]
MNVPDTRQERFDKALRPEKPFDRFRLAVTVVIVGAVLAALVTTDAKWERLPEAPARLWDVLVLMLGSFDPSAIGRALELMWESVAIAWLGTLIAVLISFPISFLAAANISGRRASALARVFLAVPRAIPEIIFAVALIPVFGLGPVAGTVAIGLSSVGTLGRLSAEIVEDCEPGPVEASTAAGANAVQRVRWTVIPQVMPEIIAFWLYRFEINIRASAVLGVVGAGGIGTMLTQAIQFREWGQAGVALIVVVVATIAIDTVSGRVRRRIIRGPERGSGRADAPVRTAN